MIISYLCLDCGSNRRRDTNTTPYFDELHWCRERGFNHSSLLMLHLRRFNHTWFHLDPSQRIVLWPRGWLGKSFNQNAYAWYKKSFINLCVWEQSSLRHLSRAYYEKTFREKSSACAHLDGVQDKSKLWSFPVEEDHSRCADAIPYWCVCGWQGCSLLGHDTEKRYLGNRGCWLTPWWN